MIILESDTKSRMTGCQKQTKFFAFYFGLHLSKTLYGVTDNLSKTLQKGKMSATTVRNLAVLTLNILKNVRNDGGFFFFETLKKAASKTNKIEDPTLPRKPKDRIIQFLSMLEITKTKKKATRKMLPRTLNKPSFKLLTGFQIQSMIILTSQVTKSFPKLSITVKGNKHL